MCNVIYFCLTIVKFGMLGHGQASCGDRYLYLCTESGPRGQRGTSVKILIESITHLYSKFTVVMMTSSNGNISALLDICTGNSPVPGEFPAQRPVTRIFGVFFDLCLNKPLSKQSWGWWFETLSCPLWRHCNAGCPLLGLVPLCLCDVLDGHAWGVHGASRCYKRHHLCYKYGKHR